MQDFIDFVLLPFRDANSDHLLLTKLAVNWRVVQVLQIEDRPLPPSNHLCDTENFRTVILLGPFRKTHLFLADSYILARTIFWLYETCLEIINSPPNFENI
jgi:hypothetical protein